jgi:alpha-beta hydrolase superfamily lysophospholipase
MKRTLLAVLLVSLAFAPAAETKLPTDHGEVLATADGVRFGVWPKRPGQPAPVLFVLAGSIEDTLGSSYFRPSGHHLANEGIVCVSVDLPCHGRDAKPDEKGLTGWRTRVDRGENFVAEFTGKLGRVLDHLIKEGIADPQRVAALGTSRGGFIAAHFAAADARVRQAVCFAPVTDLALLSEFRGAEQSPLVQQLALEKHAAALAGRPLWLVIGDRDARVGTDAAIRFARAVSAASLAAQLPAAVDLHVVAEPKGHTVPAGYAEIGAAWLRQKLGTRPVAK